MQSGTANQVKKVPDGFNFTYTFPTAFTNIPTVHCQCTTPVNSYPIILNITNITVSSFSYDRYAMSNIGLSGGGAFFNANDNHYLHWIAIGNPN